MLALSAARVRRGSPTDSAAAPVMARKSRRPMVIARISEALANFHVLPAFLLAGRLEDRSFRQRLGFLRGGYCLVEIAGVRRLFRIRKGSFRREPLIAQAACLLFGGGGRGVSRLEVGLRA